MKVKSFVIIYDPDQTDGYGKSKTGIVRVLAKRSHKLYCEDWCYRKFGNRIIFAMSHPEWPLEKWRISRKISEHRADEYESLSNKLSREEMRTCKAIKILAKICPLENNQGFEKFFNDNKI
jgi:hypothetical protein